MSGLYLSLCEKHNYVHHRQTAENFDSLIRKLLPIPEWECTQLADLLSYVEKCFNTWVREIWDMIHNLSYRAQEQDKFFNDFNSLHYIRQIRCIEKVFMVLLPLFNEAYYTLTMSESDIRKYPHLIAKVQDLRSRDIKKRKNAYNHIVVASYDLIKNCSEILSGLQVTTTMHDELYAMLDRTQISVIYEQSNFVGKEHLTEFDQHTQEFFAKATVREKLRPILDQSQGVYTNSLYACDANKRMICICVAVYYISLINYDDFFNIGLYQYLLLCKEHSLLCGDSNAHSERVYVENTILMLLGVSNAKEFVLWEKIKDVASEVAQDEEEEEENVAQTLLLEGDDSSTTPPHPGSRSPSLSV